MAKMMRKMDNLMISEAIVIGEVHQGIWRIKSKIRALLIRLTSSSSLIS